MDNNLHLEAEAFDSQIVERLKNGHIPDLRYTEKCTYFYNNIWRDPYYVKLSFGEIFELIRASITAHVHADSIEVLEVGCGPGFISLELARAGFNVTGLDLSPGCISVAEHVAAGDPHRAERGNLTYLADDFFSYKFDKKFDCICFVGALHHFKEQKMVMDRVQELLTENGIIVVHEPTRDRVTTANAAVVSLITQTLKVLGNYYDKTPVNNTEEGIQDGIQSLYRKMKYEADSGEKLQSVNDNEAGFKEMFAALNDSFETVEFKERYAFFHDLIGGIRTEEDEKSHQLALLFKNFDRVLCDLGVIAPTEFMFVGKGRKKI